MNAIAAQNLRQLLHAAAALADLGHREHGGVNLCADVYDLAVGAIAKVLHGLFGIIESFNDGLIQLVANFQKQGIIRTQTPPQNIVPLLIALAKAHLFDWVCCDGQFPLQSTL